ncbi:MAG: DUF1289 domain-containing protein [Verrucomicrobia bacterium]|nr:MAG: DUF1289 domain-containing protein [Verrucomicrobiota bacterium]PYJ98572.1 MAG: DUF1289 domain-containing protein [Verrucomicrobiota bacterium]
MIVESPCSGVCKLDAHGMCLGCFRKKEEIAQWMRMSDREKSIVIAWLVERRQNCCTHQTNHGWTRINTDF